MFLYLVRHGEAKSKEADPERSLSVRGLKDVRKVAKHLAKREVRINAIFHSNKRRAEQTAQLIAEELRPDRGVMEADGLAPMDDPGIWLKQIEGFVQDTMLVGHLPHLEKLFLLLLRSDSETATVSLGTGATACLEKGMDGSWSSRWLISPEMIVDQHNEK